MKMILKLICLGWLFLSTTAEGIYRIVARADEPSECFEQETLQMDLMYPVVEAWLHRLEATDGFTGRKLEELMDEDINQGNLRHRQLNICASCTPIMCGWYNCPPRRTLQEFVFGEDTSVESFDENECWKNVEHGGEIVEMSVDMVVGKLCPMWDLTFTLQKLDATCR
jgi:hypothetical protein